MGNELPPEEPKTLADWLWRLKEYENGIFVRVKRDGKLDAVSLRNVSPREWGEHVARFLEKGMVPVRVRGPEEATKPLFQG